MPHRQAPTGYDQARLSTTVILVRNSAQGLQVWAQERVSTMRNYPGMTVFPGGGVDRRDLPSGQGDTAAMWTGQPVEEFAARLGLTPEQTHAVVFAAVRELFEETGTLLAVHEDGSEIADVTPYHQDRVDLISHRISLTEMLMEHDLRVCTDGLRPWARWVGGWKDLHWFDTISFVAVAPEGSPRTGTPPRRTMPAGSLRSCFSTAGGTASSASPSPRGPSSPSSRGFPPRMRRWPPPTPPISPRWWATPSTTRATPSTSPPPGWTGSGRPADGLPPR